MIRTFQRKGISTGIKAIKDETKLEQQQQQQQQQKKNGESAPGTTQSASNKTAPKTGKEKEQPDEEVDVFAFTDADLPPPPPPAASTSGGSGTFNNESTTNSKSSKSKALSSPPSKSTSSVMYHFELLSRTSHLLTSPNAKPPTKKSSSSPSSSPFASPPPPKTRRPGSSTTPVKSPPQQSPSNSSTTSSSPASTRSTPDDKTPTRPPRKKPISSNHSNGSASEASPSSASKKRSSQDVDDSPPRPLSYDDPHLILEDLDLFSFDSYVDQDSSDNNNNDNDNSANISKSKTKGNIKKQQEPGKKKKLAHTASEQKQSGAETSRKDEVIYLLDGLAPKQDTDVQVASIVQLEEMCKKSDFGLFSRAHGLTGQIFQQVCSCCGDDIDRLMQQPGLYHPAIRIINTLVNDRLNVEFVSERCFKLLQRSIDQHFAFRYNTLQLGTRVKRKAALKKSPKPKKGNSQSQQEESSQEASQSDVNVDTNDREQKYIVSLALSAFIKTVTANKLALQLFKDSDGIATIENLLTRITLVLERKDYSSTDEEILLHDMSHSLGLLETLSNVMHYLSITNKTDSLSSLSEEMPILGTTDVKSLRPLVDLNWSDLLTTLMRLFQCLAEFLPAASTPTKAITKEAESSSSDIACDAILSVLRIFINVTHDSETMCRKLGSEHTIQACCQMLARHSKTHYDINILCIGLLTNLVEKTKTNRDLFRQLDLTLPSGVTQSALPFFVQFFVEKCEAKKLLETDDHSEYAKEAVILAYYSGVLLACLMRDNAKNKKTILRRLPGRNFDLIINTISEFLMFQSETQILTKDTYESLSSAITILKADNEALKNQVSTPVRASLSSAASPSSPASSVLSSSPSTPAAFSPPASPRTPRTPRTPE